MEPEASLPCSKQLAQFRGPVQRSARSWVYSEKLLAPRPTRKQEDHLLCYWNNYQIFFIS